MGGLGNGLSVLPIFAFQIAKRFFICRTAWRRADNAAARFVPLTSDIRRAFYRLMAAFRRAPRFVYAMTTLAIAG